MASYSSTFYFLLSFSPPEASTQSVAPQWDLDRFENRIREVLAGEDDKVRMD